MTDLLPFLQRLGLPQYHDALVNEGFDTWETVLDIQESDLLTWLQTRSSSCKLCGHLLISPNKANAAQKLQRAIAEHRGLPVDKPLGNAAITTPGPDVSRSENAQQYQQQQQQQQPYHHHQASVKDPQGSGQAEQKRKYRRHPKTDENAPEKPPSGYVLFSNSIREEVKAENLSFTDIAKLAGDRWQKLDPAQKELYENHAAQLKDAYNIQLVEYKKTDSYREYMHYLQQFKVKHEASADTKKPRLDHYTSSSLSATSDCNLSEASHNTASHLRGDSIGSSGTVPGHGSQSFLHLSTSLPSLHGPTGARPSPTSRHVTRPSLMQSSTQSSLSDESSSGRTDVETLQRTANLSLVSTASSTPPPPLSGRLHRGDQSQGLSYLSQPWPGWQQGHLRPVLESAEAGSRGDGQSRLAKDSPTDPRAGAASADDRPYFPAPASQPPAALPMPFSPNHEHVPSAVRRTLPPPLRQSPSTASHLPFPGFGSPSSAPPSAHFPPPSGESLALRQGNWPEPNKSETEAASTLTSLADRRQSLPPFTSSATEPPRR